VPDPSRCCRRVLAARGTPRVYRCDPFQRRRYRSHIPGAPVASTGHAGITVVGEYVT
jgi:hypothetical protein